VSVNKNTFHGTKTMMKPTIHLNGTSRSEIERQLGEAAAKVQDAIKAVCAAGPNGRDYYPQGAAALDQAMAEHRSRVERLESVYREIEAIFLGLG
jgi:hypothetical protein